jgi:hypothetical protein
VTEANHGPYHRRGEPGGPGCSVTELPVSARLSNGDVVGMTLLSASENATEVELLRTIVNSIGVQWGHDEFGWWAAIPNRSHAAA